MQALCIPRGAVHRFGNLADHDAKAQCVITTAAIGPQYFRECAEVLAAASEPWVANEKMALECPSRWLRGIAQEGMIVPMVGSISGRVFRTLAPRAQVVNSPCDEFFLDTAYSPLVLIRPGH